MLFTVIMDVQMASADSRILCHAPVISFHSRAHLKLSSPRSCLPSLSVSSLVPALGRQMSHSAFRGSFLILWCVHDLGHEVLTVLHGVVKKTPMICLLGLSPATRCLGYPTIGLALSSARMAPPCAFSGRDTRQASSLQEQHLYL